MRHCWNCGAALGYDTDEPIRFCPECGADQFAAEDPHDEHGHDEYEYDGYAHDEPGHDAAPFFSEPAPEEPRGSRKGVAALVVVGSLLAAGVGGGLAYWKNSREAEPAAAPVQTVSAPVPRQPSAPPSPTTAPAPEPSPSPSSPGHKNTTSQWQGVTIGKLRVDLPPGWSAQPGTVPAGEAVELRDSSNVLKGVASVAPGTEAALEQCTARRPYQLVEYETTPNLPAAAGAQELAQSPGGRLTPRFAFRIIDQGNGSWSSSMGLIDRAAGVDGTACSLWPTSGVRDAGRIVRFDLSTDQPSGQGNPEVPHRTFSTPADAQAYAGSDEYRTLKRVALSLVTGQ